MLRVYTRHYPPCPHADGNHRRCHCPKWINGTLPTGQFVRVSAKTRNWENAERKARTMEVNADPLRPVCPDVSLRITVEELVARGRLHREQRQETGERERATDGRAICRWRLFPNLFRSSRRRAWKLLSSAVRASQPGFSMRNMKERVHVSRRRCSAKPTSSSRSSLRR